MKSLTLLTVAALMGSAAMPALADSSSAHVSWGTGVPSGRLVRPNFHATYGTVAGQVNAGKNLTPNNISNYAIGVQNVNSVNGNGNKLDATQGGVNSGSVENNGQISSGDGGDIIGK